MHKIITFLLSFIFIFPVFSATLINDTETESFLYELISPLAKSANIQTNRLKIHIINDDDFNAFVNGGEDVYIYTGLLTQIKNPNALQGVIAHEMGHTIGGHMIQMSERMESELKRTMLIQALGIGLMVAGGNPSFGAGVLAGASGIAKQSMLSFSRDEERIADDIGIDLMIKSNINPNGLTEVFKQIQTMNDAIETKISPIRVNHPLTSERLSNVKLKIKNTKIKITDNKAKVNEQNQKYEFIRAKLIGYLYPHDRILAKYPYSDKSDAGIYARAIANMRGGDLDGAKTGTLTLISHNKKNNAYFYELLGDIEYQFGHYDDSVIAYEQSLKKVPNSPQIQTALALVLSERNSNNDKKRAIELCKTALLKEPAPLTYWVLAKLYDDSRSDWAMAEFYQMNGDTKKAKKHAKKAQKNLSHDTPEYIKSGDILNM